MAPWTVPVRPSSPSGSLAEKSLKRSIRRAAVVEAPHDAVEPVPEIVRGPQPLAEDLPPPATDVDGGECCFPSDLLALGRAAVDEFGAQLDGAAPAPMTATSMVDEVPLTTRADRLRVMTRAKLRPEEVPFHCRRAAGVEAGRAHAALP
jgi:hypothetical protein